MKYEWTEQESQQITRCVGRIFKDLARQRVPDEIAASALMLAAAELSSHALDSIEDVIEMFRTCLLQSKTLQAEGTAQ